MVHMTTALHGVPCNHTRIWVKKILLMDKDLY